MSQAAQTHDEQTLQQLREAGSDLSKPHEINHWLYFPNQQAADGAAPTLKTKGFKVVSIEQQKAEWRLKAVKTMVPAPKDVAAATLLLESTATTYGGEYDGWETQVVE